MLFSSFKTLLERIPFLKPPSRNIDLYWAHTSKLYEPELLTQHINLVNQTALKIIEVHQLEPIIEKLIGEIIQQLQLKGASVKGNFIKELFFATIAFHDYGKINENFQRERMDNQLFCSKNSSIGSQHSILSAFLFLNYYLSQIPDSQLELIGLVCAFSDPILRHHSSRLTKKDIVDDEIISELSGFLKFVGIDKPYQHIGRIVECKNDFIEEIYLKEFDYYPLFLLIKLNFSILTAADYLATLSYSNRVTLPKYSQKDWWGVFSKEKKVALLQNFKKSQSFNKNAVENPQKHTEISLEKLQKRNPENLNRLRSHILGKVISTLRDNPTDRLFYLNAPTGAGKTNISIAASMELLSRDHSLNKIFYVFPFTTLITQTYKSLVKTLSLSNKDITQLHSKAEWNSKKSEEQSDGVYNENWENHIDNLFAQYPLTLLSHIRFFDILKGNKKGINYLQHRLSNAVVIIDELQSYNPKFWEHVNYFIDRYAKIFNMQFILMSATLPRIGELSKGKKSKWVDLLPNSKVFFRNPNFSNRVRFDFSLMEKTDISLEELKDFVFQKGEEFQTNNRGRVKLLIEFIRKKTATDFFQLAKDNEDYEVILISGTILGPRRKEIVNNLQCKEWMEGHPRILVVSTQVVEAGVDIDMDLGFKDTSLIDSDEQLAGRINRNAKDQDSVVYLFNMDQASNIYKDDERLKLQQEKFSNQDHKDILTKKDFNRLYDLIFEKRNKNWNQELIKHFKGYLNDDLRKLQFQNVDDKFQLIEDSSKSVFIPLSLYENLFSPKEIKLLKSINVQASDGMFSGEDIFEAFGDVIMNKTNNFIVDKDKTAKLQSVISKFVISLYKTTTDKIEEIEKNEMDVEDPYRFGYLYFSGYKEFYSYEEGLNLPKEYEVKNTAVTF